MLDPSILLGPRHQKIVILPMVIKLASARWKLYRSTVDYQSVLADGLFGLARAVSSYRKGKGGKFSTWAYLCIQSALKDGIRVELSYHTRTEPTDPIQLNRRCTDARIEGKIALKEQIKVLYSVLSRELGPREARLLYLLFIEEIPAKKVAKMFNCREVSLSRMKARALQQAYNAMVKRGHDAIVS